MSVPYSANVWFHAEDSHQIQLRSAFRHTWDSSCTLQEEGCSSYSHQRGLEVFTDGGLRQSYVADKILILTPNTILQSTSFLRF